MVNWKLPPFDSMNKKSEKQRKNYILMRKREEELWESWNNDRAAINMEKHKGNKEKYKIVCSSKFDSPGRRRNQRHNHK
jgi:hypothetical protein